MTRLAKPPWYKLRAYIHFDLPISVGDAQQLVEDPERVASHSFWPLLSFRHRVRLWKRSEGQDGAWRVKSRPIAYASHVDSHIFAYYSYHLGRLFEQSLLANGLSACVLAYRKIPRLDNPERGKTNYDFAAECFAEIASRGDVDAIAIDIRSFFDNIPHSAIKNRWKQLLGVNELPPDHYSVFKAATRFSVVSLSALRHQLHLGIRQLRKLNRIPIQASEFREVIRKRGLVIANTDANRKWGIPQGLPISGLLANMAMYDIDKSMNEAVCDVGATYRRYSDDILIIAPPGQGAALEARLVEILKALAPLCIHPEKTIKSAFRRDTHGLSRSDKSLIYLGFEFDGQRVLLRPQTLARFSKRMLRAVRMAARIARRRAGPDGVIKIRRRELLARFSHFGPQSNHRYGTRSSCFYDYGRRASKSLDNFREQFASQIKRQLRRQTRRLDRLISEAERGLRPR